MVHYFGKNLKHLRKQHNLNQSDLASQLGIARSTISNYENCSYEPDLCNLIKISDFFNYSIDSLVFSDLTIGKNLLVNTKQSLLDTLDLNKFSIESLLNTLESDKKYYTDSLQNINEQLPQKIDEIDSIIKLIKNYTNDFNK